MELHTVCELPVPAALAYQRASDYLKAAGYRRRFWSRSFMREAGRIAQNEPSLAHWPVRVDLEVLPQQAETAVLTVIFRVNTRGRTMTDPVRRLWEREASDLVEAVRWSKGLR